MIYLFSNLSLNTRLFVPITYLCCCALFQEAIAATRLKTLLKMEGANASLDLGGSITLLLVLLSPQEFMATEQSAHMSNISSSPAWTPVQVPPSIP